ncbi:PadR family transcriptional regulator [Microbacterium sp. MYb62]|uniref:PadR family transcriptional regulator n=1 Tax=Microbacterium sp. MYb62 TaxID=1848690 RepID=UPI000CFC3095|nr:PadR family transcriptional regulator [Microbacterium sp. MYb62]PRB16494.1 PadR family transcriptional regulator [Microbacterium sp. MYb62]
MTLSRVILGFLAVHPMTGYDLMRAFATSAAYFWHADKAQIYRTLAKLVAEGLAEIEIVPGTDAPDRVVHHITTHGRTALRTWLLAPPERPAPRDPFIARVFFAGELEDDEIIAMIDARTADAEAARDALSAVRAVTAHPDAGADRSSWLRSMTLDQGLREHEEHLRWLGALRSGIREGASA